MKRMQKAIFAEPSILEQYSCRAEQVPHLFLVKKEDNQALLHDLLENQHTAPHVTPPSQASVTPSHHRVIHYDQRYYDHDVESKYCDVLVHPNGWKFFSFHRHILQEHEIQQLLVRMKTQLLASFPSIQKEVGSNEKDWVSDDHLDVNGYKLHLPPVLFGIDVMFLEYHPNHLPSSASSSQFAIAVDPSDSIYSWVMKVSYLPYPLWSSPSKPSNASLCVDQIVFIALQRESRKTQLKYPKGALF